MSSLHDAILAACQGPAEREGDEVVRRRFRFPPEFVGFAGHFPEEPILPAVVQIAMGKLLVEMLQPPSADRTHTLESVRRAKFLRKVGPDETITAQCTKRGSEGHCFDVALSVDQEPAASFTLYSTCGHHGTADA